MRSTIIYYGSPGLQAQALEAYLSKLGYRVDTARNISEVLAFVRVKPQSLVILGLDCPPAVLLGLSREIITDPSSAFPHVFILYSREPFDTDLEAVTLITGRMKLKRLVDYIMRV